MRTFLYWLPLCALSVACAEQGDSQGGEQDELETEAVSSTSAALGSAPLPDHLELVDTTVDGRDQQVSTANGFVFRVGADVGGAHVVLENHGNAQLSAKISASVSCISPSEDYDSSSTQTKTVAAGGQTTIQLRCNSGDRVFNAGVAFDSISSNASDIGYRGNGAADQIVTFLNTGYLEVPIQIGNGKTFRTKIRSNWGITEVTNNGSTTTNVPRIYTQLNCSDGSSPYKGWNPGPVAPGQTVTSGATCPRGTTATFVLSKVRTQ